LCFMIVFKWCVDFPATKSVAPDLLKTMTDFFLHFASPVDIPLYSGQQWVQITLLIICVLAVPALLIPNPVYQIVKHYVSKKQVEEEDEFSIQEVVIHQIIHTIEYVLGAVSNTASYLRLWALSLAHAQLSEVFFNLTIKLVLSLGSLIPSFIGKDILIKVLDYSGIPLMIAFSVWLGLTLCVLLGMETLSAFLHALRLHWVEFNSKYFRGEGIPFTPLSIEELLKKTRARIEYDE
jgi:V-type H+-transporting ATPase subunit a